MLVQNPTVLDDLPAEPGARIVRAADAAAWQDGHRFLEAVRQAAGKVEESAHAAYTEAYEKGYADGRAAGAIEATRMVRDTTLAVDRYLARLESEVGALALSVVRRMLGDLDVTDLVARAAAQALAEFRHAKSLRVAVHPGAVDRVNAALAAFMQGEVRVTVDSDTALDQGACIIASDFAVVDASLDVQLRALAEGLTTGKWDVR
jgi:type III secretion protein L